MSSLRILLTGGIWGLGIGCEGRTGFDGRGWFCVGWRMGLVACGFSSIVMDTLDSLNARELQQVSIMRVRLGGV